MPADDGRRLVAYVETRRWTPADQEVLEAQRRAFALREGGEAGESLAVLLALSPPEASVLEVRVRLGIALGLEALGRTGDSSPAYESAAAAAWRIGWFRPVGALYALAANRALQATDFARARRVTEALLGFAEETDSDDARLPALLTLVAIGFAEGRLADALAGLERAQAIARAPRFETARTAIRLQLALVRSRLGDAGSVLAALDEALQRAAEGGDGRLEALVLDQKATILANAGRWEDALACREQLLDLLGRIGDRAWRADALRLAGVALLRHGRAEEGIARLRASVAAYEDLGDDRGLSDALHDLADGLLEGKAPSEALTLAEGAAAAARRAGDPIREAGATTLAARTCLEADDLPGTVARARRAVALAREVLARVEGGAP